MRMESQRDSDEARQDVGLHVGVEVWAMGKGGCEAGVWRWETGLVCDRTSCEEYDSKTEPFYIFPVGIMAPGSLSL